MPAEDTVGAGRLILVRHGESEGNRDRTFTQNPEVPLTARGRDQARAAAARIAACCRPSRLVASPYVRARQTAEIIAAGLPVPAVARPLALAVELEPDLREQSFGVFAGQPYDALLNDAAYHQGPRWQWRPTGGESLHDVFQRVAPALDRIARTARGTDVVVVSHGGVMLAIAAYVTGSWDDLAVTPNAGILIVAHAEGRYDRPVPIEGD